MIWQHHHNHHHQRQQQSQWSRPEQTETTQWRTNLCFTIIYINIKSNLCFLCNITFGVFAYKSHRTLDICMHCMATASVCVRERDRDMNVRNRKCVCVCVWQIQYEMDIILHVSFYACVRDIFPFLCGVDVCRCTPFMNIDISLYEYRL